eukprot:672923-Rhodomonas_salina.1
MVKAQCAQDFLRGCSVDIPSSSINAGTALNVFHIENAEIEEAMRRTLQECNPDLLSAGEVYKASTWCLAVKSAH